jgi:asparagine synthase (glutamine-hydrolysing)
VCGICGLVFVDPERKPDAGLLAKMTRVLRSRGPDAESFVLEGGVGLGHRRLSVIDPDGGAQPMTDLSGRVTIVYNGEIYNFLELRDELRRAGLRFRTNSDTEVLLQGYLHWGIDVVPRLAGMFAFSLWDRRERTLWLVRDRLGVKPLYWANLSDGTLLFGSELSAVIASGMLPARLNRDALARYLALSYVIGSQSILEGVQRLPPASTLRWTPQGAPEVRNYWDLAAIWRERERQTLPPEEGLASFGELLEVAVRQRLISDVPLGAFLSSGVDSNTVAALMRKIRPRVQTYSIGFKEASYDESEAARRCARSLGTEHTDEVVDLDDSNLLLEVVSRLDEPFADTSIVPTYALCRMARRHVTVALSGDGGDELLAGYMTHVADKIYGGVRRLPAPLVRTARTLLHSLPDSRRKVNLLFRLKQFARAYPRDPCDAHASWRMLVDEAGSRALLGLGPGDALPDPYAPFREAFQAASGLDPLSRFLYVDYKTWLADDILTKVDRASMSHGLEVRSPFLDHRLIELCAAVPSSQKLRGWRGKHLLRQFALGLTPRWVALGKKTGFNAPVSHWLTGAWREVTADAFDPASLRDTGFLDPRVVAHLLREHERGGKDHGLLLFTVLVFVLWWRRQRAGAAGA